ncbi:MAG: arylsulfatase [Verrucomicrobiales bacterium]|nr:arylsulfatase [Verrucomicrobiales bacterium]
MRHSASSLPSRITQAWLFVGLALTALPWLSLHAAEKASDARSGAGRPNIIFLLADDLGYGDIGAFGQKRIRTPNLDQLAKDGMRLTHHYSGHNVCAPSRCVLMTGKHPGHAYIRDNRGGFQQATLKGAEGQEPVPAGELKLPLTLKQLGYTNGGFGKWGLGAVGSTGDPNAQGMDRFFGYNDQVVAHNFYPVSLWNNRERVALRNELFSARQKLPAGADPKDPASYAKFRGKDYAPDLINEAARKFLRENKNRPFFLYYPTTMPHLALQVPEDSLAEYKDVFPDEPYTGGQGYLPHRTPRAAYAAMVTRLDREIGKLLALVDDFGLRENTIVVFSSDNGPVWNGPGGSDSGFFNSNGGLRGHKGGYYEGGFRVPCIVRWTGQIKPGATSERVTGFEDWLPTILELAGAKESTLSDIDGISFAPTLLGRTQPERPFLYRESPGYDGQQCVRVGNWKAIRSNLNPGPNSKTTEPGDIELYDLANDPGETHDVAAQHPAVLKKLAAILRQEHTKSELWPIRALDTASTEK